MQFASPTNEWFEKLLKTTLMLISWLCPLMSLQLNRPNKEIQSRRTFLFRLSGGQFTGRCFRPLGTMTLAVSLFYCPNIRNISLSLEDLLCAGNINCDRGGERWHPAWISYHTWGIIMMLHFQHGYLIVKNEFNSFHRLSHTDSPRTT